MTTLASDRTIALGRWYSADGRAFNRQPAEDGSGDRPTTVADARRLGLIPSVKTILEVLAKPRLEDWKRDQAILAAARNPRDESESEKDWIRRVNAAAFEQVSEAGELGRRIHDALDAAVDDGMPAKDLFVYVGPVFEWMVRAGITVTEGRTLVKNAAEGYAGWADAFYADDHGRVGVLGYRTRRTRAGERMEPYEEEGLQLAACAAARYGVEDLPRILAANVIISTTEPGRIEVCQQNDLPALYEAFLHVCALWRHVNRYDPRIPL